MTAHWEVTDPAIDVGDLDRQWYQFQCAWHELDNRIKIFTSLTIAGLDRLSLQNRLNEIGNARAGEPEAADETA